MNVRLWQKLSIISLILVLVLAGISYLTISRVSQDISKLYSEISGVQDLNDLASLYVTVSKHKIASNVYIEGDSKFQDVLNQLTGEVDKGINKLKSIRSSDIDSDNTITKKISSISSTWTEIKESMAVISAAKSDELHDSILSVMEDLYRDISSKSKLLLEQELDGYFMVESNNSLMEAIKNDQSINYMAINVAENIEIQSKERINLEKLMGLARFNLNKSRGNITDAVKINNSLKPASTKLLGSLDTYNQHLDLINNRFVNATSIIDNIVYMAPIEFYNTYSDSANNLLSIFNGNSGLLINLLGTRLDNLTKLRIIIASVLIGLAVIVAIATFLIANGIIRQVNSMREVFDRIRKEEFEARTELITHDELGEAAESLNLVLDDLTKLTVKTREESERTQMSIIKLLDEVSGVAQGDLTKEAEVTTEITGAIADSFNYMITELRRIISDVQSASSSVTNTTSSIRSSMDTLSRGSESQSGQIIDTTAAIDEMAISIKQVSENASLSATVAQQALSNAKQGTEVVQRTIDGMNSIRDQVQETSKRIKRLGESSQEIGEITQLIGDIADRTSILALNASIQAAMAGEAGRGFAVVAEEVERLAERATDSTKRIETLIKTIQAETNDTITAMEDMTNEVVSGSERAAEAGKALQEIESVSTRLAELIQSISSASQQQARGSEAIANAMADISMITQQASLSTREAFAFTSDLTVLADELGKSVSAFKLPETNGSSPVSTTEASPQG